MGPEGRGEEMSLRKRGDKKGDQSVLGRQTSRSSRLDAVSGKEEIQTIEETNMFNVRRLAGKNNNKLYMSGIISGRPKNYPPMISLTTLRRILVPL